MAGPQMSYLICFSYGIKQLPQSAEKSHVQHTRWPWYLDLKMLGGVVFTSFAAQEGNDQMQEAGFL